MTEAIRPPAEELVPDWVGAHMSKCKACPAPDNHPKYTFFTRLDAEGEIWHHDCFVYSKQPGWESVAALIEGADGATGHALRLFLHPDPTAPSTTPASEV